MSIAPALKERLDSLVSSNEVLLFMKGSRTFPQCGFSATVVQILDEYLDEYETVNVLADPEVRSGVKEFSDWPTIPQLYVKGEFVGGCDIIRDLYSSGELDDVLGKKAIEVTAPSITLTESAIAAFKSAQEEDDEYEHLRLEVNAQFQHALSFGPALDKDVVSASNGMELRMDKGSARRADGLVIDFVDGPDATGFKIDNPNAPARIVDISAQELKARLDAGLGEAKLIDVRTSDEREDAAIMPSVHLTSETAAEIDALPKDTELIFYCARGGRSMRAAQAYAQKGFKKLVNLAGGITDYANVDPSVRS